MSIADLYADHHHDVEALARRITRDDSAGADVAARTFEVLPEALETYKGNAEPRSFLMGVCANLARRFRRSDARRRAVLERLAQEPTVSRDDDPEAIAARREMMTHVVRALDELPPEQRNAFLLATIEDCTSAEIAAASGVPEATVRTRIFHARRKLREALERSTHARTSRIAPALIVIAALVLATAGTAVAAPHVFAAAVRWIRAVVTMPSAHMHAHPIRFDAMHIVPPAPMVRPIENRSSHAARDVSNTPTPAPSVAHRSLAEPAVSRASRVEILEPAYVAAHQLHFVDRDYARALEAWDAYLATAPHGRLALEARYNRAMALAHLRRFDEARAALEPFASGTEQHYRESDAQRLLNVLPH